MVPHPLGPPPSLRCTGEAENKYTSKEISWYDITYSYGKFPGVTEVFKKSVTTKKYKVMKSPYLEEGLWLSEEDYKIHKTLMEITD